ncbi:hypothetical protein BD626DRAFT_550857 [Schizophyllum amplum]|uniref:DUF6589 domain-containing protein n=1 Tax=Schizophyllum amplum TaxID=97359 RepID=A0A550BZN2_9AGAR|nr:hypothetical protein BD626DRAFT_550857 [Auriculariopsis ampla]
MLSKNLKQRVELLAGRGDVVAQSFLSLQPSKAAVDIDVDVEDADTSKPPFRRAYRTLQQKLDLLWWFISEVLYWSYGEMLYHTAHGAGPGMASHTQYDKLSRFFRGHDTHFAPSKIIKLWFSHAYGSSRVAGKHDLYALSPEYSEIKGPMRAALTAFAAQVTVEKLERDAEAGIKPANSLHSQPGEVLAVRKKRRPIDNVATNIISTMMFRRSNRANLLPVASGILHFGCLAAFDIHRFNSRVGNTPCYNTLIKTLGRLAEDSAAAARAYGEDPQKLNIIRLDNVHNYHLNRDLRIGRENKLLTGIFGVLYEAEDYVNASVSSFSIDEKRHHVDAGKRAEVTVDMLHNLVDFKHINTVLALQWVQVLVDYIPELAHLSKGVQGLYKQHAAKDPLPVRQTKIHPLACCSKNEMYYTELRDAYGDILEQIGQTRDHHDNNLVVAGGDGFMVQKTHEMQEMLQHEENVIDKLENLLPTLKGWHQRFTSNNEHIDTHYGEPLTSDYSTLGHSATRLGRRRPADLKKFDYAQGSQLMYLVLDARMLDCWRLCFRTEDIFEFFAVCKAAGLLPSVDGLFTQAKQLTRAYMSLREHETVLSGEGIERLIIPVGEEWDSIVEDDSSKDFGMLNGGKRAVHTGSQRTTTRKAAKAKKTKAEPEGSQYSGDLALANSRTFMRIAALSRESMIATAAGDPGRVYEVTKCQLFQFAGSSCTNYTEYLLETIISLEYESSPEMKTALLRLSLVNLTGKANHFCEGDLLQEYFNRLLDAVAQHKGVDYSDPFLRNIWSRNVLHVAQLRTEWVEGVGLGKRSARHSDPTTKAEIRTLLALYRGHQLHVYRAGRVLDGATDRDRVNKGVENLKKTRLTKYIGRTSRKRGLARRLAKSAESRGSGQGLPGVPTAAAEESSDEEGGMTGNAPLRDEDEGGQSVLGVAFAALDSEGRVHLRRVDFQQEATAVVERLEEERQLSLEDDDDEEENTPGTDEALPSFDDPMLDKTDDETA